MKINKDYSSNPDYIKRRVAFLLAEARHNSPRDQIITFTMRVLSNYASVGFDGGSDTIKKNNKVLSLAAIQSLRSSKTFREWTKNTINEHPTPLKFTWSWLVAEAHTLTESDVWNHFVSHPMVTVLKEEDDKLNKNGYRSVNDPNRYEKVGIQISIQIKTPEEIFKNN